MKASLRKFEARTREALVEAMSRALDAVTALDARGFFELVATVWQVNCYDRRSSLGEDCLSDAF